MSLPSSAWKTVRWREGTRKPLRSRFAALRIRPDHRDYWSRQPRPEEWLLIEWPKQEAEPTKYWLSTLPANTNLRDLVRLATPLSRNKHERCNISIIARDDSMKMFRFLTSALYLIFLVCLCFVCFKNQIPGGFDRYIYESIARGKHQSVEGVLRIEGKLLHPWPGPAREWGERSARVGRGVGESGRGGAGASGVRGSESGRAGPGRGSVFS
jgi:hypothetical protein